MILAAYLDLSNLSFSDRIIHKNFGLLIKELKNNHNIPVRIDDNWIPTKISFIKKPPKLLLNNGFKAHEFDSGVIKIEVNIVDKPIADRALLLAEFKVQIENLSIAAQISYPGSLCYNKIFYFINKSLKEINEGWRGDTIMVATEKSIKEKWPPFKKVSFNTTWAWLSSFEDVVLGFSKSQTGRVINSLKNINKTFDNNDMNTISSVIWSVMGIEALFLHKLESDRSKIKELTKRIIFFLGKRNNTKLEKRLSEIYGYRSRLLHGDADFPSPEFELIEFALSKNKEYQDIKEFTDFSFETSHTLTSILISSFQKLIILNKKTLTFDTKYFIKEEG